MSDLDSELGEEEQGPYLGVSNIIFMSCLFSCAVFLQLKKRFSKFEFDVLSIFQLFHVRTIYKYICAIFLSYPRNMKVNATRGTSATVMAKLPYRTATRMKVLMKTENDMDSVPTGNQE